MSTGGQIDLGSCGNCGAEDWELEWFGQWRRILGWLNFGRPAPRYEARCRQCGSVVRGPGGSVGDLGPGKFGYQRGGWAAPFRAYRVLRDARTAVPVPRTYALAALLGVAAGIGLELAVGWPWWLFASAVVVATWLVFMSTAFRHAGSRTPQNLRTQLRDAIDPRGAWSRHLRRQESIFRSPPFPLYGLPSSWEGRRFVGGMGWGGMGDDAGVDSLALAHGNPLDPDGAELRVESSVNRPGHPGHPGLPPELVLRELAEELWHQTERPPRDLAPEQFRSWAESREREFRRRETPSFARMEIPVDGRRIPFDYVAANLAWVAVARVDEVTLTLSGRNFQVDHVELVTVTDVEPYLQGSRNLDKLLDD